MVLGNSGDIREDMWCYGSTLAWNARDGYNSCSRHNISHFHDIHDTGYHDHDPIQAMSFMVLEPSLCLYKVIACMYVIVSIKRLTIPGG